MLACPQGKLSIRYKLSVYGNCKLLLVNNVEDGSVQYLGECVCVLYYWLAIHCVDTIT